ncbi:MAG: hypothetical protein WCP57_04345 [Bacteroidota bacterium]
MKKIQLILLFIFCFFISNALDLKGLVVDNDTKLPISGAWIRIFINGTETGKTNTSTDGNFTIPLQRDVVYKVYIDKKGYEQIRLDISTKFSSTINDIPALDIALIKAKTPIETTTTNTANISTTSAPNLAPSIVLKGKVYHQLLGGLAGTEVQLKNNSTGIIQKDITIENGNYVFNIEPNSNYTLSAVSLITHPIFIYENYLISTLGVNSSVQIVRNFENKGEIIREIEVQKESSAATSVVKKTKKNKKDIVARNIVVKITDVNPKEKEVKEIVVDNTKAKELEEKKQEELKLAEAQKIADQKKIEEKLAQLALERKQIEEQKKLAEDKKLQIQNAKEQEKQLAIQKKIEEQKLIDNQVKELERIAEEKRLADEKALEEKKQIQIAYNKYLDSIVAYSGPRFMHSSKTKEDIARETKISSNYLGDAIKDTSIDLPIASKPLLPINVDENRTPVIDNKIYFGPGKAILDEEAKKYLLEMSNKLIGNLNLKLNISVHADANDEASVADYICKLRTKNITDLLLHKYNVNFSQLVIRSAGSVQGANGCKKGDVNCTELDHQMNRRVEVSINP